MISVLACKSLIDEVYGQVAWWLEGVCAVPKVLARGSPVHGSLRLSLSTQQQLGTWI